MSRPWCDLRHPMGCGNLRDIDANGAGRRIERLVHGMGDCFDTCVDLRVVATFHEQNMNIGITPP